MALQKANEARSVSLEAGHISGSIAFCMSFIWADYMDEPPYLRNTGFINLYFIILMVRTDKLMHVFIFKTKNLLFDDSYCYHDRIHTCPPPQDSLERCDVT